MSRTCVALLRGINVGGRNIIRMSDLKTCFEEMGHGAVRTFIQSGNVIFQSDTKMGPRLINAIEAELSERFGYRATVIVLSRDDLAAAIASAPAAFGRQPARYRYDVLFVKPPLTPRQALRSLGTKEGVDAAFEGTHVVFFSRLISEASQSRLSRIATSPIYPSVTIRNWNTTTKLLALMETAPVRSR